MEWRDVLHSNNYEVSDEGLVRNKHTERILTPSDNGHGVLKVILSDDGDQTSRTVARMVGEAFVLGHQDGYVIFHMDDDKRNCNADNLQWRPRWFAQEWATQSRRTEPMRPWAILMHSTETEYKNSLICAKETYGIETYIVLACGRQSVYNHSTYDWIR